MVEWVAMVERVPTEAIQPRPEMEDMEDTVAMDPTLLMVATERRERT